MLNSVAKFHVGTSGWNIPQEHRKAFLGFGSLLEKYSRKLNCVEINSSFYRNHQIETYSRWAECVPEEFRFSVKLSRHLTHELMFDTSLLDIQTAIEGLLALREKLGALLVQLPPRLEFHSGKVNRFFDQLRRFYWGPIAIEPRNLSWLDPEAAQVLQNHLVSTVESDPCLLPGIKKAQLEAGRFRYARLHGSPDIYRSTYSFTALKYYQQEFAMVTQPMPIWCVFDNTAFGHAITNALQFTEMLGGREQEQMQFSFFSMGDLATERPSN